jgi:hypothetical protein
MILFTSNQAGQSFSHRRDFLPLLKIIASYPFPKPQKASKTYKKDWVAFDVMTFTDAILLNALDPKRNSSQLYEVRMDEEAAERLHFKFRKSRESGKLLVLDNLLPFLDYAMVRQLFLGIVHYASDWRYGVTSFMLPQMYQETFTSVEQATKLPLDWLNYFDKKELEKWNGPEAFESNPYLQTERIHDGLLVQLGDNPTVFETPEGKRLFANAINALLPLSVPH